MKNFVVKSVVLFVGVALCSGVVLGMESREQKLFSDYSELLGLYTKDLYSGKIMDYKKAIKNFDVIRFAFEAANDVIGGHLLRFENIEELCRNSNDELYRSRSYEDIEKELGEDLANIWDEFMVNYYKTKPLIDLYYDKFMFKKEKWSSRDFATLYENALFGGYITDFEREITAAKKYIKEDKDAGLWSLILKKFSDCETIKKIVEKQLKNEKSKK